MNTPELKPWRVDKFGRVVSTGEYARLPAVVSLDRAPESATVCVLIDSFVSLDRGVDESVRLLALTEQHVESGDDVFVLIVRKAGTDQVKKKWSSYLADRGVRYGFAEPECIDLVRGPTSQSMKHSYLVYEWMKQSGSEFDVVVSSDSFGFIYLCQLAKEQGLRFAGTRFVVLSSRPRLWRGLCNAIPVKDITALGQFYLERLTVELADYVLSFDDYMLNWMYENGYMLEQEACYSCEPCKLEEVSGQQKVKAREFAFYGGFEPINGYHLLCDAVATLHKLHCADGVAIRLTFAGWPVSGIEYEDHLEKLATFESIDVNMMTNVSFQEFLEYVDKNNVIVVAPAIAANAPVLLEECVKRRLPFIAGDIDGLSIDAGDTSITFECHPRALAEKLFQCYTEGCPILAPSGSDKPGCGIDNWLHLVTEDGVSGGNGGGKAGSDPGEDQPLVSICMAHFNRGDLLLNALESIEAQDYPNIEVIIVDDGSDHAETLEILDKVEHSPGHKYRTRVFRQENRYLGAVRNSGVRLAEGEYVLFMDDDNEAKPEEVSTFVRAAQSSGCDILTSFSDVFTGDRPHNSSRKPMRIAFNGANLSSGLIVNAYGDSNFFIRKSVFEQLNGFSEHYKVGKDDMEFLSRAILSGVKMMVVPEALYWYRINENRMRHNQYSIYSGCVRVSEVFTQCVPPDIANIFRYAQGLGYTVGPTGPPRNNKRAPRIQVWVNRIVEGVKFRLEPYPRLYDFAKSVFRILLHIVKR